MSTLSYISEIVPCIGVREGGGECLIENAGGRGGIFHSAMYSSVWGQGRLGLIHENSQILSNNSQST